MAALLGFLAAFLSLSASYAARLQLWGDEAYSLRVAARSVEAILSADPFHLATYYLVLHPVVGVVPAGGEFPLRLLHALIFCVGLVFCWRIARSLLGRGWALWGVLALTILLPNYIFYATTIRMYALLFAASLAFLWTAFRLLEPGGGTKGRLAWHGLTALLCALVDWPGLLLVGLTWVALIALKRRSLWAKRTWSGLLFATAGLLAVGAVVVLREPILHLLLEWPSTRAAPGRFSVAALAKALFFQIRPLLDLVYPPVYPLALNLVLWLLLALALPVAVVVLWRGGDDRERLVVVLALSWLVGSPFGFAVTRAFLPSQFFVLLTLALALQRLGGGRGARLAPLLWGCLIAVGLANLQQAIDPTLRLYSRIPYPSIARDALAAARERNLPTIAISRHTLNALSVERFARPRLSSDQELRLLDVKPDCASFPRGTFVYVQLMEEDGEASDLIQACRGLAQVRVEELRSYVKFADLAYNPLWRSNLNDRGEAAVAARLWIVTIAPPADVLPPSG